MITLFHIHVLMMVVFLVFVFFTTICSLSLTVATSLSTYIRYIAASHYDIMTMVGA